MPLAPTFFVKKVDKELLPVEEWFFDMKGRNIQAIIFSVILAVTFIVRLDSERMGTRFLVLGIGVLGIILIRFAESIAELVNEWRARGYNKNPVDPTPTRGAIIAERVSGYCYYIISLVAIILI